MAELIRKEDTLNQGREKLNNAILDAEKAKNDAATAKEKAETALVKSENTQRQLDTIVIEGDSSVEAAQARVSSDGTTYSTLKERLDTEYDELSSRLAETEQELIQQKYFISPQNLEPSVDMFNEIQSALNEAKTQGGRIVYLPQGTLYISDTIVVPRGVSLIGQLPETWGERGTQIRPTIDFPDGKPLIRINEEDDSVKRSVRVENIMLLGNGLCDGLYTTNGSYNIKLSNIIARSCRNGFTFDRTWNITANQLIAQNCEIGFYHFNNEGTSSTFTGCLAYACRTGYQFESGGNAWTYSSWLNCGTDGCDRGLIIRNAMRGCAFYNFGVEGATEIGIRVDNPNAAIAFHAPLFSDHSNTEINLFEILRCQSVTIYDWCVPSAISPKNSGKILSIPDNSLRNRIILINERLFGSNIGDIDNTTTLFKVRGQKVNQPTNYNIPFGTDGQTRKIDSKTIVLIPDGGNRFLAGSPTFNIDDIPDYTIIDIVNGGDYELGLRTESHTEGTGIVRHPDTTSDTLYARKKGSQIRLMKIGDKLHEIK